MLSFQRTDSKNSDFQAMVVELDADLAIRDGDEHDFYHQFNGIENLHHVLVVYANDYPVACGALKEFSSGVAELKRMYCIPEQRGQGIATATLRELENWALENQWNRIILETGKMQPEAIALYQKNNYRITENYSPYIGKLNSVCMAKLL